MDTPIYDFVKKYSKSGFSRFHMPAHKGVSNTFLGCEPFDITEIYGADNLFAPCDIIKKSEENASSTFDTKKTIYSTCGSTLSIQTMLALACCENKSGETPVIIAVRNVHTAFVNACTLLDIDVEWVFSEYSFKESILTAKTSPQSIEKAICKSKKKPVAVYVTSPDYLGNVADISGISLICKKYKIPLLVDNAHGSYLHFLEKSCHPIHLGAQMCCDSAHKTLPVLTGGGYLHISRDADDIFAKRAKEMFSLFSTTSPSYLTLASLDLCNKFLDEQIKDKLSELIPFVKEIKVILSKKFQVLKSEPLKIVLSTINSGLYGYEIADILRKRKIECEYADKMHIVFMISPITEVSDLIYLKDELINIRLPKISLERIEIPDFAYKKGMSLKKAYLSEWEKVNVELAFDRICGKTVFTCPPGIPVCISGEVVSMEIIKILKMYGINEIYVVK